MKQALFETHDARNYFVEIANILAASLLAFVVTVIPFLLSSKTAPSEYKEWLSGGPGFVTCWLTMTYMKTERARRLALREVIPEVLLSSIVLGLLLNPLLVISGWAPRVATALNYTIDSLDAAIVLTLINPIFGWTGMAPHLAYTFHNMLSHALPPTLFPLEAAFPEFCGAVLGITFEYVRRRHLHKSVGAASSVSDTAMVQVTQRKFGVKESIFGWVFFLFCSMLLSGFYFVKSHESLLPLTLPCIMFTGSIGAVAYVGASICTFWLQKTVLSSASKCFLVLLCSMIATVNLTPAWHVELESFSSVIAFGHPLEDACSSLLYVLSVDCIIPGLIGGAFAYLFMRGVLIHSLWRGCSRFVRRLG